MNRENYVASMTKREQAAKDLMVALIIAHGAHSDYRIKDLAADAVAHADALYDELDTPRELRDDDFDHDGTP